MHIAGSTRYTSYSSRPLCLNRAGRSTALLDTTCTLHCPPCSFGFFFLIMKDTLRSNGRASECRAACSQDAIVAWHVAIVGSSPLASTWAGVQTCGSRLSSGPSYQCQSHVRMLLVLVTSNRDNRILALSETPASLHSCSASAQRAARAQDPIAAL